MDASEAPAIQQAGDGARWRIVLLTCRDPRTDFRLPLAESLQRLGHDVAYVHLKRRPAVVEMAAPDRRQEFSLAGFLRHARRAFRPSGRPLLVFNSTNLVFPGLSRVLRALIGGLWCFDMHDDLLYASSGMRRRRLRLAQSVLLQGSDVVVHAAPTLQELFPRSRHLGNASAVGPIARPQPDFSKILVLASLDRRIDFGFLARAAALNPTLTFDIHGQVSGNDPAVAADLAALLAANPNIAYHGAYDSAGLPAILACYAVTLAPYVAGSRLTRYIDPLRYYHCLNSGMEVVSTGIPKARDLAGSLHVIAAPKEFGPLVERLRDEPSARRNAAPDIAGNSWAARASALMAIVADAAAPRGARSAQAHGSRGSARRSVVIYLPNLTGGGAERLQLRLAPEFLASGAAVTFLLDRREGELVDTIPQGCRLAVLDARRQLAALPKLVGFLRRERPDVLISNMEHMNVMSVLARFLARVPTRVVAVQHIPLSEQVKRPSWQWRSLPFFYRRALPAADAVVAVSSGVADELARMIGMDRSSIQVIHNGVVARDFAARAAAEPDHPWFAEEPPVVLAMGRMVPLKDFATLIEAFAAVARKTSARLMVLGEGPMRAELEALVDSLALGERVAMPGFVENPLPFLRRSRLFVLSSRFEGFGNVIAEALACGTPVVSTDCPYGPAEILDGGRYGELVAVGDAPAMADAIVRALAREPDRDVLKRRGADFSVARCAEKYLALIGRRTAQQ